MRSVAQKIEMCESLADIEIAMRVLNQKSDIDENPVDSQYRNMNCEMRPLDVSRCAISI